MVSILLVSFPVFQQFKGYLIFVAPSPLSLRFSTCNNSKWYKSCEGGYFFIDTLVFDPSLSAVNCATQVHFKVKHFISNPC